MLKLLDDYGFMVEGDVAISEECADGQQRKKKKERRRL